MTKHSLTTAELKVIESEDEERRYLISVGKRSERLVTYLRIGDVGDPDIIFAYNGYARERITVPKGRPLYAWTDAGTAELCTAKQT